MPISRQVSDVLVEDEPRPGKIGKHLIAIPGTDWSLWRWVGLRSAGFPFSGLLKLSASEELRAALNAVQAETDALAVCRRKALETVESALDDLRTQGRWSNQEMRKDLLRSRNAIYGFKPCRSFFQLSHTMPVAEFNLALERLELAHSTYQREFLRFRKDSSETIRNIARRADFREALTWQNPAVARRAVDPIALNRNRDAARGFVQKQREELIASYWQRYCAKNDTIGFFGPVGWARFADGIKHFTAKPGKHLIAERTAYWECWTIKALAAAIEKNQQIQPWIAPISLPMLRVEDRHLHHPRFGAILLTDCEAALLLACNGKDTAKQIARALLSNFSIVPLPDENGVYATLKQLEQKGYIFWHFHIPSGAHPETGLRNALEQIEDEPLRYWSLALLNELEAAKAGVEASHGNEQALDEAYENLEKTFTRITGAPASRHAGKVYAGRTLIYLDCRRDVEVSLGSDLLSSLGKPLGLLLDSARWFAARVAETYRSKFRDIHSEFVRSTGEATVDAAVYLARIVPYFYGESQSLLAPVQQEFRDKWERVLELGTGTAPVTYTCQGLREKIQREFPACSPGWSGARYHSPDIMIAASDQAIRQGDYQFVVGELHTALNTLVASLFINQHPSPQDLLDAVEQDYGGVHILPVSPSTETLGSRSAYSLLTKSTYFLEYSPTAFATDRSRVIRLSSLVLENQDDEIIARSRDGTFRMPLIELTGWLLSLAAADCFKGGLSERNHTPRISIERLIISRETWRIPLSDLHFLKGLDSAELFLQTRTWARDRGIPRFVFVKIPLERQPSYLDFDSPIFVDIFARLVRRAFDDRQVNTGHVEISEMLPAMDQLWLPDAQDQRYTSELRCIALDTSRAAVARRVETEGV
jgi:Lantibiotic dehydratase, N terminus